jgi:hypothetical protein
MLENHAEKAISSTGCYTQSNRAANLTRLDNNANLAHDLPIDRLGQQSYVLVVGT